MTLVLLDTGVSRQGDVQVQCGFKLSCHKTVVNHYLICYGRFNAFLLLHPIILFLIY